VTIAPRQGVTANPYPDPARRPRPLSGPLDGITVTDFCWMGVGSLATRLLADFGARVIRIEDRNRLDMPRRLPFYKEDRVRSYGEEDPNPDPNKGGNFNNYNRNKLGITLNMREPEGRQLVDRLISMSSVLSENFAPGVMERWGLTEAHVRQLRPDIIYARMSGFGHSGPYANYRSYGPVVQAVCGLSHISGLPGREPSGWGLSYMDNQAAYYNSAAILMAIFARNRTGVGTDIDVSAVEARRLEHARRAAAELGVTVLLKGSTTVIAEPGSETGLVNPTGTSWLATAGSGDVLSGLAGALLAQGLTAPDAAIAAAYLHGLAGRLAAAPHDMAAAPISAQDIIQALPGAFRSVTSA